MVTSSSQPTINDIAQRWDVQVAEGAAAEQHQVRTALHACRELTHCFAWKDVPNVQREVSSTQDEIPCSQPDVNVYWNIAEQLHYVAL